MNHTGEKHSPSAWRMSNALESWSWAGCEGRPADVEVYGRGAEAELLLNGKPAGRAKLKNCVARFRVTYQPARWRRCSTTRPARRPAAAPCTPPGETQLQALPEATAAEAGNLVFVRAAVRRQRRHRQAAEAGQAAGAGHRRHAGGPGQRLPLQHHRLPHRYHRYLLRSRPGRRPGGRFRPGDPHRHDGDGRLTATARVELA